MNIYEYFWIKIFVSTSILHKNKVECKSLNSQKILKNKIFGNQNNKAFLMAFFM